MYLKSLILLESLSSRNPIQATNFTGILQEADYVPLSTFLTDLERRVIDGFVPTEIL